MRKNKTKKILNLSVLLVLILAVYLRIFFIIYSEDKPKKDNCKKISFGFDEVFIEEITGLKFIRMDFGKFLMGSPEKEKGRKSDESPVSEVCISEFMISETEVRVKDFERFVFETNYKTTAEKKGFSFVYSPLTGKWEKKTAVNWKNPGFDQTKEHPVVHVSFFDALEFSKWLDSKYKKIRISLPTEHQWEYAAKKGLAVKTYGKKICEYSNCADLSAKEIFPGWKVSGCTDGHVFTSPVKSFNPDKNGLYDMSGNVWEWCNSEYKPYISRKNSRIYGKKRNVVIKGGSFYSKPEFLRPSAREHLSSGSKRAYDTGFRLIITGKNDLI